MGLNPLDYARSKILTARNLLGPEPASDCYNRSADELAAKYNVVPQFAEMASALIAEGEDGTEARMSAFWAARRFFAPDDDGGMMEAANELAMQNEIDGAELDAEMYALVAEIEAGKVEPEPVKAEYECPVEIVLPSVLDRTEDFIRREYREFYTLDERKHFNAHLELALEMGLDKTWCVQHAHTQVIERRMRG